jgi:hypothetical protein
MICPRCRKNLVGIVQLTRYRGAKAARRTRIPACLICGHVVRILRMPKDYEVPNRKLAYPDEPRWRREP